MATHGNSNITLIAGERRHVTRWCMPLPKVGNTTVSNAVLMSIEYPQNELAINQYADRVEELSRTRSAAGAR